MSGTAAPRHRNHSRSPWSGRSTISSSRAARRASPMRARAGRSVSAPASKRSAQPRQATRGSGDGGLIEVVDLDAVDGAAVAIAAACSRSSSARRARTVDTKPRSKPAHASRAARRVRRGTRAVRGEKGLGLPHGLGGAVLPAGSRANSHCARMIGACQVALLLEPVA